jgi:hypothetical protein
MATNLFAKAKSTAATKTTEKKDSKVRIKVDDVTFFEKVQTLETLQDNMKRDKAKADMISDEIKDLGKEKWAELYDKSGRNPGSVMLESVVAGDTAQVMFVPSDKYISLTQEKADILREEFGDNIVEEKTTFAFDNDMIEKYGEVLSRLIEESDEISDDDKGKIIKAVTAFSVSKGTIDVMKTYGNVSEVMEQVKPVISLKNVEVVKG